MDTTYSKKDTPNELLESTFDNVLFQNEISTIRWTNFKEEHEALKSRLLSFRDKLKHDTMVPVGKLALLRGKLVHTNEILVSLGDGWFAKRSAKEAMEICDRRIKYCNEMLDKLNKEKELFTFRQTFPKTHDLFSGDEIIEPFDEEAEVAWREKHRERMKSFKQQEFLKRQKNKNKDGRDVLKLLDTLEVQEEIKDELNRLQGDGDNGSDDWDEESEESESDDEDEFEEDSEEDSYYSDSEEEEENTEYLPSCNASHFDTVKNEKPVKIGESLPSRGARVSFAEVDGTDEEWEPVRITFKHSYFVPETPTDGNQSEATANVINSPSDIYKHIAQSKGVPKSILKKSTSAPVDIQRPEGQSVVDNHSLADVTSGKPSVHVKIGDVVEKSQVPVAAQQEARPVSKFKAARQAMKRDC